MPESDVIDKKLTRAYTTLKGYRQEHYSKNDAEVQYWESEVDRLLVAKLKSMTITGPTQRC